MRRSLGSWLARGLAVAVLTIFVALWVLVKPLPEPAPPTLTPTSPPTSTPPPRPTSTPTPTQPPTPTSKPTATPSPTATQTSTPTSTPGPTDTAEAEPTLTPTTVAPPSPTPYAELAGRVEQHTYFSQTTGQEEPYRIYLPPDYDQSDRRYPVLYLIHGWPYDESHWDNLGADEVADSGIQAGAWPPFIIVLPGADPDGLFINTSGGDHSFEGQVVNDLIPHIDATYRTWAERDGRAIGGISRGGVWSLEIGLRRADLFAAVGGHSPALSLNLASPTYDPFYLLEEPGVAALRIYLDAGDADWARESTQALHETLDGHGIAHEFVVHAGGHDDGLWAANVAEYLAFYTAGWPGG